MLDAKADPSPADDDSDSFYSKTSDVKADPSPASSETPGQPGAVQTEAATEPAEHDKEPDGKDKSPRSSWRELRTAKERAEAERDLLKQQLAERKAEPLPATAALDTKPEATGKPKPEDFPTYEEYLDARDKHNRSTWETEHTEAQRKSAETQAAAAQQKAQKAADQAWTGRVDEARKAHPDFDKFVFSPSFEFNDTTAYFGKNAEHGALVLYALASNPKEAARIAQMNELDTLRELWKLEAAELSKAEAGSTPQITKAPRPSAHVGGNAGVPKELSDEEVLYG